MSPPTLRERFGPTVIVFAATALLFHRFVSHTVISRDSFHLYGPLKFGVAEGFRRLTIYGWDPSMFLGMPYAANPLAGWFYPLNLIYLLLPFDAAHTWFILIHYPLAAVFMEMFLRGRGLGRQASILGGFAFALSGYMISMHGFMPYLIAPAWAPLALYFMDRAIKTGKAWVLGAGAAVAMQVLAGEPQSAAMTCFLLAVTAAANRRLALLIISILSAVLLSAAQVLPAVEMMKLSTRAGGVPLDEALRFSFDPARLVELVWPFPQHEGELPWATGIYIGLPCLLLALFGAIRSANKMKWPAAALAVLFLLIALGSHFPLYEILHSWLPGFDSFRFPEKFLAGFFGGAAVLSALGLDTMLRWRKSANLAAAICVIVVLDLYLFNVRTMPIGPADAFSRPSQAARSMRGMVKSRIFPTRLAFPGDPSDYAAIKVWERETLRRNLHAFEGLEDVLGYSAAQLELGSELFKENLSVGLIASYNAKYLIVPLAADLEIADPSREIYRDDAGGMSVFRIDCLPRAYFVGRAVFAGNEEEAAKKVLSEDLATTVVITGERQGESGEALPLAPQAIAAYEPDRVTVEVRAPKDGWLVLSDRMYPGWRATIDGERAEILTANVLVRAVRVTAGAHRVEFTFQSWPLRAGMAVSGAAWIALAAFLAIKFRKKIFQL